MSYSQFDTIDEVQHFDYCHYKKTIGRNTRENPEDTLTGVFGEDLNF